MDHFSAIALRLANPSSNLEPTIFSILKKMVISLLMYGLGPYIACVTLAPSVVK